MPAAEPPDRRPAPGMCDGPPAHLAPAVYRFGGRGGLCRRHLRRALRKATWPDVLRELRAEDE